MRQKRVRWSDIPIGTRFRFWGSDFKDYTWIKVSETASMSVKHQHLWDGKVESLDDLRRYVIDRPVDDRTEWYGVK